MAGALRTFQGSLPSWSLNFELREELRHVISPDVDTIQRRGGLLSPPRHLFPGAASDTRGEAQSEKDQAQAGAGISHSYSPSSPRTSRFTRITGEWRVYRCCKQSCGSCARSCGL